MKRIMRILLVVGLLAGGMALCSPSSEAGPFGRGPFRRAGWGGVYGPGWGYTAYRPYGYGWGGFGPAYRPSGWGYGGYGVGYPVYGAGYGGYGFNYPAYGAYGAGYPAYGYGGYPGFYGTRISVGSPLGGFYMSSYPY
jgi:hypothetical protein